jgi:hypothetical protein
VDKSGRFSVNCHAWISRDGLGELYPLSSNFNSQNYLNLLETELLPKIISRFGDSIPIYMHDNAPIHTAKIIKEFLNNFEGLAQIDWPVKGADLNLVENIWAYLQHGVSELIRTLGKPKNSDDLCEHIVAIRELMKLKNYTKNLYESMPKRIAAVHSGLWDWSKY